MTEQKEDGRLAGSAADRATREPSQLRRLGPDGRVSTDAGHTAGPWTVSFNGTRVYSKTRTEYTVADCAPAYADRRRIEANARLIAAAPELLGALRECADKLWVLRCNSRDDLDREAAERACDMATAAIAKAHGK